MHDRRNAWHGWRNVWPAWRNAWPGWRNAWPGWRNAWPGWRNAWPGWRNAWPGWRHAWPVPKTTACIQQIHRPRALQSLVGEYGQPCIRGGDANRQSAVLAGSANLQLVGLYSQLAPDLFLNAFCTCWLDDLCDLPSVRAWWPG
eukprot:gene11314-biopygen15405